MINRLVDIISVRLCFELYLIIYNFQKDHCLFCVRDDVPRCPDKYGRRYYCLICQFYWKYDLEELEDVKHFPLKLIAFYEKVKTNLFEIVKYSSYEFVFELWMNTVIYTDKYTRKVVFLEDFINTFYFL